MKQPLFIPSELDFLFKFECNELPVLLFLEDLNQHSFVLVDRRPESPTVAISKELSASLSDLELSRFALSFFQLICVVECLGFNKSTAISQELAARMDQLPPFYSRLWLAAFDAVKSKMGRLN